MASGMIVTNNGAVRYLTFGKVSIPIRLSIHMMTDDVRHMSKAEHRIIIRDSGMDCPGGMDTKQVMLMVMSLVQIAWFKAEGKTIPAKIWKEHATRCCQFFEDADRIKRNGPTPKVSKLLIQLEIPGTPEPTADPREVLQ